MLDQDTNRCLDCEALLDQPAKYCRECALPITYSPRALREEERNA